MNKLLFIGAYGIENAGDDLPLIVFCEIIRRIAPNKSFQFHALSRHPSKWEEKSYGVKMIKNIEYESREEALGKWFKGLNVGDDKGDLERVVKEIRDADLLVIGAGNFLIDITIDLFRGPIPLFTLYVFLAKLYHKPVMLYGFSAGPIKTALGRELSRYLIENSDIVTVRDRYSKMLITTQIDRKKKVWVLPDPNIWPKVPPESRVDKILRNERLQSNEKKKIAIGLRNLSNILSDKQSEHVWNELAYCLNALKSSYKFIFIPQSTYREDDDREIAKEFVRRLDSDIDAHIITKRYHPNDLIGLYSNCNATIAIRLHSAVFSVAAGTPAIAISYLSKVEGFMNDMGLGQFIVNVDKIEGEALVRLINYTIVNNAKIRKTIVPKIRKRRKAILSYARHALSLL